MESSNDRTDLYEILELPKKATKSEIRAKYKKLALKYHPDNKDDGNNITFISVNRAYEILSDPELKAIYDKYGFDGLEKKKYEKPNFEGEKKRCKNLVHFLFVSLEDIYNGSSIPFEYTRRCLCQECDGTGTDNPAARVKCPTCQGSGEKVTNQRMGIYIMQSSVDCEDCEATGWQKNQFICEVCKGKRSSFEKKSILVELEKGMPDHYRFTFYGEGNQQYNIEDGDLIVEIIIKKHKYFTREGADLYYTCDLTLLESITGFKRIIPSINGMERIEISSAEPIQQGEVKVILGKGLPFYNKNYSSGNLFVNFNVVFPTKLDELKLELVEKLLPERLNSKPNQDKKENVYYLSDFKPEEANLSIQGGLKDQDNSNFFKKKMHIMKTKILMTIMDFQKEDSEVIHLVAEVVLNVKINKNY